MKHFKNVIARMFIDKKVSNKSLIRQITQNLDVGPSDKSTLWFKCLPSNQEVWGSNHATPHEFVSSNKYLLAILSTFNCSDPILK